MRLAPFQRKKWARLQPALARCQILSAQGCEDCRLVGGDGGHSHIAKTASSCWLPVGGRTLANMLASLYACFINAQTRTHLVR
jgi:hypothetical protein